MLRFEGRKILHASGNAKIDMSLLAGQKIKAIRTWGKHLLLELPNTSVRVHFLMFGSYTVNARKDRPPRLQLQFKPGELNFYTCAVKLVDGKLDDSYDWTADVMSPSWDAAAARRKLRKRPDLLICDALLDQEIFAGVGNIIKNEVLFRVRVHPLSTIGALPAVKLRAVVEQARQYSFEFLDWRRENVLRQHWQAHNKGLCPNCGGKLTRAWLGSTDRRSFFCEHCQKRYGATREPAGARRATKSAPRKKTK
jgi:endonuclease-8